MASDLIEPCAVDSCMDAGRYTFVMDIPPDFQRDVLTGAALIGERERGTIEHLLVMPPTPFEIMLAKVWSMGLIVVIVAMASIVLVVKRALGVPIEVSMALFVAGMTLNRFRKTIGSMA